MNTAFEKLLLSELRIVTYEPPQAERDGQTAQPLSDDRIAQAMTVNEELRNLGYTLRPADILRLAGSPSLIGFADHFRSLLPSVDAAPMYPDFPKQVMEMDEAEFRMHQMIHYFSTYGLEDLFGTEIRRGWLPDVSASPKEKSDKTLLECKVLELMSAEEAPFSALCRTLAKRERMTQPAREMIKLAIPLLAPERIADVKITFKENLIDLFDAILEGSDGERRIQFLQRICQHTGDVLKCVGGILPVHDYHFRTGQKRAVVKLLESYPVKDFTANLILSRSKREKSLIALQYLDYNVYSRSAAHREAVRALRNGELRSWEAQARYLVGTGDEGALDFIAARPGMMLRMLRWLLRTGYRDDDIRRRLAEKADALSLHTTVDILNALDDTEGREPREDLYEEILKRRRDAAQLKSVALKRQLSDSDIKRRMNAGRETARRCYKRITAYLQSAPELSDEKRAERLEQARIRYEEILRHYDDVEKREKDPVHKAHRLRNAERTERLELEAFERAYKKDRALYEKSVPLNGRVCAILLDTMYAHMKGIKTELSGKKVYPHLEAYDLSCSRLKSGSGSEEGGYLPPGIAIRIPEEVRYLRFFIYWNDKKRVDVDLHATAVDENENRIHVGWNGDFNNSGILHSGDITHSDAAEYIDIDLEAPILRARTHVNIYSGKESFKEIETCYVGMMAVREIGEDVKLYDPKNCFFTHALRSGSRSLHYGYVDVPGRRLFFEGKAPAEGAPEYCRVQEPVPGKPGRLTMERYLSMLFKAQEVTAAASTEEADLVLTMEKSAEESGVSLVDRNLYLDA